jgi:tRNA G37 N-methylase Trm5
MKLQDFRDSLTSSEPPSKLSRVLMALWWDAKQDWTRAHECAQPEETSEGAWVHAYLHRKEGDRMAGRANRCAANRWKRNGCKSRKSC